MAAASRVPTQQPAPTTTYNIITTTRYKENTEANTQYNITLSSSSNGEVLELQRKYNGLFVQEIVGQIYLPTDSVGNRKTLSDYDTVTL